MPTAETAASWEHHFPPARAEALANQITELCALRYVLEARFLDLLREFDEQRYWERLGFASCAHWMNMKCSIGLNSAREKLRVAHALAHLPKIAAGFAEGRLSYSKVRAMTRIADESNEDYLMMIAKHGTAWHVETLVRKYRGVMRLRKAQETDEPSELRSLEYHYDSDGMLVIRARLPAEQGALVVKALEQAMDEAAGSGDAAPGAEERAAEQADDVTAVTSSPIHARRADALVDLAESKLSGNRTSSAADRYSVIVHVTAVTLQGEDKAHHRDPDVTAVTSHLENGPHVTAVTSRRLACDGAIVPAIVGARHAREWCNQDHSS